MVLLRQVLCGMRKYQMSNPQTGCRSHLEPVVHGAGDGLSSWGQKLSFLLNSLCVRFVTACNELPAPPHQDDDSRWVRCGDVVRAVQTFKSVTSWSCTENRTFNCALLVWTLSWINWSRNLACSIFKTFLSRGKRKREFAKLNGCNAQTLRCLRC